MTFVCGPAKGEEHSMRCGCLPCGFESDDPNDFAVSLCWECAFGECEHDVESPGWQDMALPLDREGEA